MKEESLASALNKLRKLTTHVRAQRAAIKAKYGPYAVGRNLTPCPGCGVTMGVRQLQRHRKECPGKKAVAA